jgi:hypothetical protein
MRCAAAEVPSEPEVGQVAPYTIRDDDLPSLGINPPVLRR